MPIPVKTILDQARHTLVDADKVYWLESELIGWYNAAVLAVIAARPDAHAKQVVINTIQGTLQTLPSDALRLIRVIRNESAGKRPITDIAMDLLDRSRPDWHSDSAPAEIAQHYVYDPRDPRNYYLYPAMSAGKTVRLSYSYVPPSVTEETLAGAIMPIDDVYFNSVLDFMLWRGFSKDGAFVQNGRARTHLVSFNEALGIKMQADDAMAR